MATVEYLFGPVILCKYNLIWTIKNKICINANSVVLLSTWSSKQSCVIKYWDPDRIIE